jgi:phage terminase large subunit
VDVNISYRDGEGNATSPLPHQEEYHLYTGFCKHHLLAGSLGTGKTEAMCMEAIHQSAAYQNNLGLMGRKVLDSFKKSTLIQLLDLGEGFIQKHRAQEKEIIFKNRSKIVYMALDDSRDSIQRIKSMNLGWFAFDQLEEMSEQTFIAAAGQMRRKHAMRVSFHTCNPAGHDWVWHRFKKNKKKQNDKKDGYRLIETMTWQPGIPPPETDAEVGYYSDNPHLPSDYIKHLLEMPSQWVNRYVYCSWDDFAGAVYPEFDEEKHLVKPFQIPDWWNHYVVYDYGYRNPTAILFAAVDEEGNVYVYDLIYKSEHTIDLLVPKVERRLKSGINYTFLADPSIVRTERDGNSVADEWYEYGIEWEKAKNDKRAGFERVSTYLKPDINGKCKLLFFNTLNMKPLVDEIVEYRWKELKHGFETRSLPEEPIKKNDHAMDTLRYLVHYIEDSDKPSNNLKSDGWLSLFNKPKKNSWMSA